MTVTKQPLVIFLLLAAIDTDWHSKHKVASHTWIEVTVLEGNHDAADWCKYWSRLNQVC